MIIVMILSTVLCPFLRQSLNTKELLVLADLPNLTSDDVKEIVPDAECSGQPFRGGQKIVFPCTIDGQRFALKFLNVEVENHIENESTSIVNDEVLARAVREVEIMNRCTSPYLVKMGPIPLRYLNYNGQGLIYFSETWIEGQDLKTWISENGPLAIAEVIKMGKHITCAIDELWTNGQIHRDIKPGNIMISCQGDYILLDYGLAFDLMDVSLTRAGAIPGTLLYLSPDQIDYPRKRQLDFRSDLFTLGVVLYEAITGYHPFYIPGMTRNDIVASIVEAKVAPPSIKNPAVSNALDEIILRLLAKVPHLRYRACSQLLSAFDKIQCGEGD